MSDEIIEQAAQVLSTLTTCDGEPWATELHRRQAQALADSGLLARPLPTKEDIATAILYAEFEHRPSGIGGQVVPTVGRWHRYVADAVLALLKGQEA